MAGFSFRPRWGLTIATLAALAILITLGTWQYQRLQWKTALLAEIDQSANAPPLRSISELQLALDRGAPVNFRRLGGEVSFDNTDPQFHFFTPVNKDISWRPFVTVQQSGDKIFARGFAFPDTQKTQDYKVEFPPSQVIAGYIRVINDKQKTTLKSSPEKNRWFGFNPVPDIYDWSDKVSGPLEMRAFIDIESVTLDAADLPPKRPVIANNHFDYMLTWYGLALTLLVIYIIFHMREGRLKWRKE